MKIYNQYGRVPDEKLMEMICLNDSFAFEEIYNRYSDRLLYFFFRMLGKSRELAQDKVQDLFMKIIEAPERFDSSKKFSTWIFSVANNMCKNEYRKMEHSSSDVAPEHIELYPVKSSVEETIDLKIFRSRLQYELNLLSENDRATFLLRFRENMNTPEIAEALDCPPGTIRSRLCTISKKLGKKLAEFRPMIL